MKPALRLVHLLLALLIAQAAPTMAAQEPAQQVSYATLLQPMPSGVVGGAIVVARSKPATPDRTERVASVTISILKSDRTPISSESIKNVQIFATDGTRIEFRGNNPPLIEFHIFMGGLAQFDATYELANSPDFQKMRKVTFRYLDNEFSFDMSAALPNNMQSLLPK